MALLVQSYGFYAPDGGGGTQVEILNSSYWGSEAPKTHLLVAATTDGNGGGAGAKVEESIRAGWGWSDATDQVAIGVQSRGGIGTSDTDRIHTDDYTTNPLRGTSGIYERATTDSYTASTPRITQTWTESADDGYNYWLLALGGSDVENISIDTITGATSTGDVSYTGPGFQPDFLIVMWGSLTSVSSTISGNLEAGMGFSDGTTDAVIRGCSVDAVSTSQTNSVLSANFIHEYNASTEANTDVATVKSLDSGGYTLTWSAADATARKYTIIAVKGPSAKVVTTTQPASDGNNDVSAGFIPKGGICIGAMKTASASVSPHNRIMTGSWDQNNNMNSSGWMDEDDVSTMDTDRYLSAAYSIQNYGHAQNLVGRAAVAVNGNGIRETWSSTDGTQYAHSWLLLGDKGSAATTTNEAFLLFLDTL